MPFQNEQLPFGAKLAGSTPVFNQESIPVPLLKKHMAPQGMCGYLKVLKGSIQFVWDDTLQTLDADPEHPIVIFPERYHHVRVTRPVEFKVEFYKIPNAFVMNPGAARPGIEYIKKK